ncbi:MAG: bifunctional tetrahydrofolate synthase/dihydrofolate synthase [Proteobacteria bacterium]|nr:bifunctional tetrahydrofolate synthase/dihydrofolate synthase [Pseudomonadota bacterium]
MTLDHWLAYIEKQHPANIELGLDRLRPVYERMAPVKSAKPTCPVIAVAGTNGKGSSVAMLASILRAAGHRVGTYTSPHLVHYNERVAIDGRPLDDASLCAGFEAVEAARGDTPLTYFEYGTLCAFWCLAQAELDAWILEVGLGGRLDAVNIIDADVALITRIGLDHQDWLGDDREKIGFEKAGIMRSGKVVVCSDPQPPAVIAAQAHNCGAQLLQLGADFDYVTKGAQWDWQCGEASVTGLPRPALMGDFQLDNAAGVLAVAKLAGLPLAPDNNAIAAGLQQVRLAGRLQRLADAPEVLLDVAHNADSAAALSSSLSANPGAGDTLAVWAMYQDKDIAAVARIMKGCIDQWYVGSLPGPRGAERTGLTAALTEAGVESGQIKAYDDPLSAYRAAIAAATDDDRIVVFGSFETAGGILAQMQKGLD